MNDFTEEEIMKALIEKETVVKIKPKKSKTVKVKLRKVSRGT
jgi:hypothetical protein